VMFQAGLIGTGYWGPNLANAIERSGKAKVRWLCDKNSANLAALAQRYPHAWATTCVRDLLEDPDLDAIFIATPTITHHELGKQALQAGKHVLVEKPMTTSSRDALELVRLAEEQKRILMVGHVFEYNRAIEIVDDLINSGELGDIYYMNFERTNLGPVRTDVNALWDLVTHDASIMCDFMKRSPISVTAKGQCYLNSGIEDVVFATFIFDGGVAAHVHASWLNPNKVRQVTVVGNKKMVVCDDLDLRQPVRIYDKRVRLPPPTAVTGTFVQHKTMILDGGASIPVVQSSEPLVTEIDHFLDCIALNRRPRSDGVSGLRVVRMMEAAAESIAHDSAIVSLGSQTR
jgi:predicted dehydrogenase